MLIRLNMHSNVEFITLMITYHTIITNSRNIHYYCAHDGPNKYESGEANSGVLKEIKNGMMIRSKLKFICDNCCQIGIIDQNIVLVVLESSSSSLYKTIKSSK